MDILAILAVSSSRVVFISRKVYCVCSFRSPRLPTLTYCMSQGALYLSLMQFEFTSLALTRTHIHVLLWMMRVYYLSAPDLRRLVL